MMPQKQPSTSTPQTHSSRPPTNQTHTTCSHVSYTCTRTSSAKTDLAPYHTETTAIRGDLLLWFSTKSSLTCQQSNIPDAHVTMPTRVKRARRATAKQKSKT
ncbi:unnamed protein product [Ectocarpus sp. 12 AP-2014]